MGFSGGDGSPNDYVVRVAMKKGSCMKGNQTARVYSAAQPSNGLFGQAPECNGCQYRVSCLADGNTKAIRENTGLPCSTIRTVECLYHSTVVLGVFIPEKKLVERGWTRSSSTRANIGNFEDALRNHLPNVVPSWVWDVYGRWVRADGFTTWRWQDNVNVSINEHRKRFKPPWVFEGAFYWEKYDPTLAKVFEDSVKFLKEDRNYRYFRFDWTDGSWGYNFIDSEAKRRYTARQKKRRRDGEVLGAVLGDADGTP